MKTGNAFAVAVSATSEPDTERFHLHRRKSSRQDLLARIERANRTIRTLEQRVVSLQETYMVAMQDKNRKIRELELSLQSR